MFPLRHLLTVACTAALLPHAHSQCGTHPPSAPLHPHGHATRMAERGGGAVFVIPTVVHIHYGGGIQPMGILHVQPMLDRCNTDLRALNADLSEVVPAFAGLVGDMGMELRLATIDENGACMSGIQYHAYDPEVGQPDVLAATLNTRHYLNIHIFPSVNSFATLPGQVTSPYDPSDVVVLSTGQGDLISRTLTHEMGHWAGLLHTFGGGSFAGVNCGEDYIDDTPTTAGSPLTCVLDLNTCVPGVIENVQNHMDYSSCRVMFTQGQAQYAASVLADPNIVRASVVSADNLVGTGVTTPAPCAMTAGIYHRASILCSGTTLSFRAMAEHAWADSVRWTFTGGDLSTSTDDQPLVFYTTTGDYPVQLTVYGGGSNATVEEVVHVEVPDPNANGLSVISTFPFTEGFENGFTLPQPNLFAVESLSPTWQPFAQAGYASANSLYVPAEPVTLADTNDLVIGNFDFSTLTQATVQFKVSASIYDLADWSAVQLLFRDQCSNIFGGSIYFTAQLNEYATAGGMDFVPSSDGQWTTLTSTHPEWNMATSAELILRMVRPAYPSIFHPEAVYVDDLYVGELPISTGVVEANEATFLLAPNPAHDRVRLRMPSTASGLLRITDAMGRLVEQQRISGGMIEVNVAAWAPGAYLCSVISAEGRAQQRLMVE